MTLTGMPFPPAFWRIGRVAITGGLILLLWQAADGPAILHSLTAADPRWIAAAITILMCQTMLSALRWKVTAAALGQTLPARHAVREYFMSQAVNQSLPGGVIGDAARAVRARAEVGLAISGLAVGLERLAGQIAMFVALTFAFIITYFWQGGLDWPDRYAAALGLAIGLVSFAVLICMLIQGRTRLLTPTAKRWVALAVQALLSARVLPAQIGLGVLITLCNLAAFGLCAWAIGQPLSLGAVFAVVPLILFTMLIPLTISGWGLREGSAAILLPIAGMSVADAVATSVLFGLVMLLAVIPGFVAMVVK
ncbi:MAG: lysylphosphatidylglycerol synthase transmembrane domain-containing protein [Pseudomonadota bacterium]